MLTTAELGYPAVVASNTYSLFAPARTPPDIVDRLDHPVLTVLRDPELRESFAKQEASPAGDTPERSGRWFSPNPIDVLEGRPSCPGECASRDGLRRDQSPSMIERMQILPDSGRSSLGGLADKCRIYAA